MRSARLEDTTAAARIREAAIVRFGRQGFARTSVREIAADAGVSPALVIHHYGSKDALRETCDEWLTKQLLGDASRAAGSDFAATMREWAAAPDRFGVYIDYFAMMVSDGTEAGNRLFDRLVQDTAVLLEAGVADGSVNKSSDPEMRALL
ncbi:MAG TPA: TetR family transcriptional regulator, partial [Agromyces sp.]|nr:TetR family transcriptional regulator [Agromyces sp.]